MGKSKKKVCGGTVCVCKSQKKGKQFASRRFRRKVKTLMANEKYDSLPRRSIEITSTWNLGGDGKFVYSWNKSEEIYAKFIRK